MTSRCRELLYKSHCPNQPTRMPGRLAPFLTCLRAGLWYLSSPLWAGKPMRRISAESVHQHPGRAEFPARRLYLFRATSPHSIERALARASEGSRSRRGAGLL